LDGSGIPTSPVLVLEPVREPELVLEAEPELVREPELVLEAEPELVLGERRSSPDRGYIQKAHLAAQTAPLIREYR
jgi:hypothetical protein